MVERTETVISRRKFLGGLTVWVIGTASAVMGITYVVDKTRPWIDATDPEQALIDSKKPGEWIKKEPVRVISFNNGDTKVKVVNIRSDYDLKKQKEELDAIKAGTVSLGTMIDSIGTIKGRAGIDASQVFYAVTKEELMRLKQVGQANLTTELTKDIYYINARYLKVQK